MSSTSPVKSASPSHPAEDESPRAGHISLAAAATAEKGGAAADSADLSVDLSASHKSVRVKHAKRQRNSYEAGWRGDLAYFFGMKDAKWDTINAELIGGLTMFLVTVYILALGRILQAGFCESCVLFNNGTSPAGFTAAEYRALPTSISLTAGMSTILMGIFGGIPLVVAPGVTYGTGFQIMAAQTSIKTTSASQLCWPLCATVCRRVAARQSHHGHARGL